MENSPRTMRALVKEKAGTGLKLVERPIPEIGPGEVLIRVDKAGICGTDLHIYEWDEWSAARVKIGTIVGHEFMGCVVDVGGFVKQVAVGERVSAEGHVGCGHCYFCRTGQGHICSSVQVLGVDMHGAFADYVKVPEKNVWPLHPGISDEIGAMLDPLGNAMHTVMADCVSGQTVVVIGAGTIGLLIAHLAKAAGALDVVSLDVNPSKLRLAQALGAGAAEDPREPEAIKRLLARTRYGQGFDVMLEASGSETGIRTGLQLLRRGGWAALLGIPKREVSLDLATEVIFKGITIYGINGRRMFETWYQMESFLTQHRVQVEPVITHRLPFGKFEEGFRAMQQGEAAKVILDLTLGR